MDIAPTLRQALEYVQILEREGYQPTASEVDSFIGTPRPKGERPWGADMYDKVSYGLGISMPRTPAEKVSPYLLKVGWLQEVGRSGVGLSDLGSALLSAVQREPFGQQAVQVTLDPADPLVYLKFSRVLEDCGDDALLADAYFKHDSLWWLVNNTAIRRVMVKELANNKNNQRDLQELRLTLGNLNPARPIEIRSTTGRLHDRCVIPTSGNVVLLGTSVNSIGTNLTVAVRVQDEPSEAYRDTYQKLWIDGTVLEPITPTTQAAEAPSEPPEAESKPAG